jgi:methionine biosynthesis protein MetW
VLECIRNDVNVLQMDLEDGLAAFADRSFDHVILSETLQAIHRQEPLLREMLRVGREAIVSFPNFGFWKRAHPDRARRPHAGVEGAALPVVRHAQRAPLHAGRFRGRCAPSSG